MISSTRGACEETKACEGSQATEIPASGFDVRVNQVPSHSRNAAATAIAMARGRAHPASTSH